jgi:hypothetical protein
MKIEQIECFETSAYKIQTPGNHPEENIQKQKQFTDYWKKGLFQNVIVSNDAKKLHPITET